MIITTIPIPCIGLNEHVAMFFILDIGECSPWGIAQGGYLKLAISRERGKTSLLPNEMHNTMLTYKQLEFPLPVFQWVSK